MGHVGILVHQHPQMLLFRAALDPFCAQPVLVLGIAPTQMQVHALGLVEFHEDCSGPPLKLVKVPLGRVPFLVILVVQLCFIKW